MPLTRKRATIWTCSDGSEHTDFIAAAELEARIQAREYVLNILDDFDFSNESKSHHEVAGMIFASLWAKRENIAKHFSRSRAAFRREAVPADREAGKS